MNLMVGRMGGSSCHGLHFGSLVKSPNNLCILAYMRGCRWVVHVVLHLLIMHGYYMLAAGYEWQCAYSDLVIAVRVLCLFHNN